MRATMTSFTHLLDDCAKVLEPFIESSRRGSLHWNGSEYAPVSEDKDPDPYALAWWSTLCTISALLSSQSSLTPQQYSYIERELFGGMGSFTDFWLDEKRGERKPGLRTSSSTRFETNSALPYRRSDKLNRLRFSAALPSGQPRSAREFRHGDFKIQLHAKFALASGGVSPSR